MKRSKYIYNSIEAINYKEEEIKGYLKNLENEKERLLKEAHDIYLNYYESLNSKEFILYDNFLSLNELEMFLKVDKNHPLYKYSKFNLEELAEIIKYTYEYYTDKEFKILAYGLKRFDYEYTKDNIHTFYLAIGNDHTLNELKSYDGYIINYFNDLSYYHKASDKCHSGKERIIIKPKESIRHYGDLKTTRFDVSELIISGNIEANLASSKYQVKGINNLFSFKMHPYDQYLAKVLLSIIVYKRNNDILELSESDYQKIFPILFHANIDIYEDIKKDFSKSLSYTSYSKKD